MSSTSRDLVNNHGAAGKGDKPRTPMNDNWRKTFEAIDWKRPAKLVTDLYPDNHFWISGFEQCGTKRIKKYGT